VHVDVVRITIVSIDLRRVLFAQEAKHVPMTASTYLLDIIGCGKTKYLSKNTEHSEKT
jgi:hypothetical protein